MKSFGKKLSLYCSEQQLVFVETVVVELVPVVEGGALGLQHHQGFLSEAQPALAGGRAEGGGLGLEGPGDGVVLLLLQPLVL